MYEKYSTMGCVERLIQHEAEPSAVFTSRHSLSAVFFIHARGSALTARYALQHHLGATACALTSRAFHQILQVKSPHSFSCEAQTNYAHVHKVLPF